MLNLWFSSDWFAFIGKQAVPGVPGSPYAIAFRSSIPESSGMKPMNVSTYSCGDISLGCSCGDCPASQVCSNSAPASSQKEASCSVRIGSLKVSACVLEILNISTSTVVTLLCVSLMLFFMEFLFYYYYFTIAGQVYWHSRSHLIYNTSFCFSGMAHVLFEWTKETSF